LATALECFHTWTSVALLEIRVQQKLVKQDEVVFARYSKVMLESDVGEIRSNLLRWLSAVLR
jgi:hypothetical protein